MTIPTHFKSATQIETEFLNFNFGRLEISTELESEISKIIQSFKNFCAQSQNHKQIFDGNFYQRFNEDHNNREIVEVFLDTEDYLKAFNCKIADSVLLNQAKDLLLSGEVVSLNAQIGDYFAEITDCSIFSKHATNQNAWKLKFSYYPPQIGYLHSYNLLRTGYSIILYQSSRDLQIFNPFKKWGKMQYADHQISFIGGLKTQYLSDGLISAPNYMVPESEESKSNGRICLQLENTYRFYWPKKDFKIKTLPPGAHYKWGKKEIEANFA